MPRLGGLQLCFLALLALAPAAAGAHLGEELAEAAAPGAPPQQIMRSEGPRAQAQGGLADQGLGSARGGARVVPGAADPPLDAGIKLSYPSYPFFGSVVVVGEEGAATSASQPVSSAYSSQPVSSGYSSHYSSQPVSSGYSSHYPSSQPAAYPSHAYTAPAPAPVAVSAGVSR
ncbi:unnamed protein product [Prorocentrum cordatum]|uniref:Uncharacterized protein n=1 Tax=Prorocentrum cordatum TaxID=2364126 RepID=A0ABN9UKI5_9DINO|nr:unnamed protein product [Polarella glacialis]